jgi:hypothetical protein
MGPFRTIEIITGNPLRSRPWKVIDVTLLSALWVATIASILIWLAGNEWSSWSIVVRILPVIAGIATAQSWYQHPSPSKKARARTALERQYRALSHVPGSQSGQREDQQLVRTGPEVMRDITRSQSHGRRPSMAGTVPATAHPIVLRCTSVQATGVLWTLVGLGLIVGGALWIDPSTHQAWFLAAAGCAIGTALVVTGLAFLHARIELRSDSIATYWGFAQRSYPTQDLVDAVLAQPRRWSDLSSGGGSVDLVRPGANWLVFSSGYLLAVTFRFLAWLAIPGSSSGESLHLIPRLGDGRDNDGPACHPCGPREPSAHHAVTMVRMVIRSHQRGHGRSAPPPRDL